LDLALSHLPRPRSVFAFGIDVPVCFTADSTVAHVAPQDKAVVHLAKYLDDRDGGSSDDERELDHLLDLVQPGWRPHVLHRRFCPRVVVTHALVAANTRGLAGRPDGLVPGIANAFLAGDWIGPTGQLADAAVASALRAARVTERVVTAS